MGNPFLAFFLLGSIYALATGGFFAWYVISECVAEDNEPFLCSPWKFGIIPAVVLVPALAPSLYLLFLKLSENHDVETLPPLLFRALYGYTGLSYHFVHCANGEALRNGVSEIIIKSEEEQRSQKKKRRGRKKPNHQQPANQHASDHLDDTSSEGSDDERVDPAMFASMLSVAL